MGLQTPLGANESVPKVVKPPYMFVYPDLKEVQLVCLPPIYICCTTNINMLTANVFIGFTMY